jgi:hypothetical protein
MITLSACNASKRLTGKHHKVSDIKHKYNIKPLLLLNFSHNLLLQAMIFYVHATQARDSQESITMSLQSSTNNKNTILLLLLYFPDADS